EERVPEGPEGGQAADLIDPAAGAEGREGEAAEHIEGVAEEEQPEGGEGPGGILPEEEGGERQGDEREVPLHPYHPARQRRADGPPAGAEDGADLDRAAQEDGHRPGEEHPRRTVPV